MPEELKNVLMEDKEKSVESFIRSRPFERERELISAASECLRLGVPLNEAEILGRCRRIRYAGRAGR